MRTPNTEKKINNAAFTIVEVLITSAITVVIMGVIISIYLSGTEIWEITSYQTDLQTEARAAVNFMTAELRNATRTSARAPSPNAVIPGTPNNNRITFYLPQDTNGNGLVTDANGNIEWNTFDPIQYQYVAGQKTLVRIQGGQQRIIARDVAGVQFIDAGINPALFLPEIKVVLTLNTLTPRQRNITITLAATIRLRN